MKIISFWFVFLIVNVIFFDFINDEKDSWIKGWEIVGLAAFEIFMIFVLFEKVF